MLFLWVNTGTRFDNIRFNSGQGWIEVQEFMGYI
jgi:hypothetical protein